MKTSDFDYNLPEDLIAQTPLEDRSSSRLLIVNRKNQSYEDHIFTDIIDYLNPGDALVLNETKVLPARIYGVKEKTHGAVELLLLKQLPDASENTPNTSENTPDTSENAPNASENTRNSTEHTADTTNTVTWECLARPQKRLKKGVKVYFGVKNHTQPEHEALLVATVLDTLEEGITHIQFEYSGIFLEILEKIGTMPLPPYIHKQLEDQSRYQTVYAKNLGSAAAPTAGLHFTPELLQKIAEKGVKIVKITLHVGLGTFRPVQVDDVKNHIMHTEKYEISNESAKILNQTKENGGRIIAVGTTSVRTLESNLQHHNKFTAEASETSIFIYPGFKFKAIDGLITNFHLPKSTLLMLVSAFSDKNLILSAYQHAISERYRFFSFGDAMLII